MMTTFRDNMKVIFFILIIFFVGWMAFTLTGLDDWLVQQNRQEVRGMKYAGTINGEPINREQYQQLVQNQVTMVSNQRAGAGLSAWEADQIAEQVWSDLITEQVLKDVYRDHRIVASSSEVVEYIRTTPLPELRQAPELQTDGRFDFDKYHALLANPRALGLVLELERDARDKIHNTKLFLDITSMYKLTDAQLVRIFKSREDKVRVSYVHFPTDSLVPDSEVEVGEEEIESYYRENPDRFKRPEMAAMSYIVFPVIPGAQDTAAAVDTLEMVLERLEKGEPWDSLAAQFSQDRLASKGGDLGWFARGDYADSRMADLAFSLRAGKTSQPAATDAGMLILRVDSTRWSAGKREVKARRIVRLIEAGTATVKEVGTRARAMRMLMRDTTSSFTEIAADSGFVTDSTGLFSLGSQIPQLEVNRELIDFLYGSKVGSISYPITTFSRGENDGRMIILARLDQRKEKGEEPLGEASAEIRGRLMLEKKKSIAADKIDQLMIDYDSYDNLEMFVGAIGYALNTPPEFTRATGLPLIGRNNAFIGAAFGLPVGSKSQLIEVDNDFYLLEVLDRTEAQMEDFEKDREALANQMRNVMMQTVYSQFNKELFEKTKIEDLRRLPAPDSLEQARL
ncbi:MAG: peptidyl-prolyl cis-trans isomerase [Candidatus Glassbacteria bacterium]|nr:peptidyl-prolyl cis-trans isomerase [Candidatus Glassbacteria bacterium]